jgi:hypothetical protein
VKFTKLNQPFNAENMFPPIPGFLKIRWLLLYQEFPGMIGTGL